MQKESLKYEVKIMFHRNLSFDLKLNLDKFKGDFLNI